MDDLTGVERIERVRRRADQPHCPIRGGQIAGPQDLL
jgi:hypothetical protein